MVEFCIVRGVEGVQISGSAHMERRSMDVSNTGRQLAPRRLRASISPGDPFTLVNKARLLLSLQHIERSFCIATRAVEIYGTWEGD